MSVTAKMTNYTRQQVLLEPWQIEYLKSLQKGRSYSSVIRLVLDLFIIENGLDINLHPLNERDESFHARMQISRKKWGGKKK